MSRIGEQLNITLGLLFSKLGLPPNLWTLLSLIPAFLGFAALYHQNLALGLVLFALSDVFDAVDGAVARVTKSVSNLGAFLDGVIERYVEALLYFGLLFYTQNLQTFLMPNYLWIAMLIFGALMVTFVVAYADHKSLIADKEYQKRMEGRLGRNSRIILLYAGMLLGCFNSIWLVYTIAVTSVFVNVAALRRVFYVIRQES